jgi:hypothetical protein
MANELKLKDPYLSDMGLTERGCKAIALSSQSKNCDFEQKCLGPHEGTPSPMNLVELYLFPRKEVDRGVVAITRVSPQVCPCITISDRKDFRFYKNEGEKGKTEFLAPQFSCKCKKINKSRPFGYNSKSFTKKISHLPVSFERAQKHMSVPFSSDCQTNHAVSEAIHSQLEAMLHRKGRCQVILFEVSHRGEIYSIKAKELTSTRGFLQIVPNVDK